MNKSSAALWAAGMAILATTVAHSSGCSGEPSEPVSGTLQVDLTTPFTDDGALLFTVTGGRVDSVETLYSSRPDAVTLEVILTGDLRSGTIARMHIPDGRLAAQYSVKVIQAAARVSYAQRDPVAYELMLSE
jgi:hypothetical protein